MLSPAMLEDERVKRWLGGAIPAWTLLDWISFVALRRPPSSSGSSIRLATDLSNEDSAQSAMVRNTLILLAAAAKPPGLKLTVTGNLSRQVVASMFATFDWPRYDKAQTLQLNKVINEPDFLPLFIVRNLAEVAKLVRKRNGHLVTTPAGRMILEGPGLPALQSLLFEAMFWKIDLAYFNRGNLGSWPQDHVGLVFWSLGVSASQWMEPARLARLSTIPVEGILRHPYDLARYAIEGAILRNLEAFGLFERRVEPIHGERFGTRTFYRKTAFFDRFLTFNVQLETEGVVRH